MDRGVTRRDVFGRRLLAAAAAAAAVLSFVAGLYAVYTLREEYRVLNTAMRESAALLAAANSSEEALARCKSFMRSGGGALPVRPGIAVEWMTDRRERHKTMNFKMSPGDTVYAVRSGRVVWVTTFRIPKWAWRKRHVAVFPEADGPVITII